MGKNGNGLRERFLARHHCKTKAFDVPGVGTVELRGITANQRGEVLGIEIDNVSMWKEMYPLLVSLATYDPETGELVFDEADAKEIGEKDSELVEAMALEIMALSGLRPKNKATGEPGSEQEIAKNSSSAIPSGASTSD